MREQQEYDEISEQYAQHVINEMDLPPGDHGPHGGPPKKLDPREIEETVRAALDTLVHSVARQLNPDQEPLHGPIGGPEPEDHTLAQMERLVQQHVKQIVCDDRWEVLPAIAKGISGLKGPIGDYRR